MTREIHMRILKPSPTRQEKFSKREGLFQKPLDIFQRKREENIGNRIFFTPMQHCNTVTS